MSRYYDIVKLRKGEGIVFSDELVTIDLDRVTPKDIIQNDDEFNANLEAESYFYLSGGGTFLLKERYLLTVQRSQSARVNPGKISIFTGRSEGPLEWREPWRLVRELFEEVVLFEGRKMFYPHFLPYQEIIDEVYRKHFNDRYSPNFEFVNLNLQEVFLGDRVVKVLTKECGNEYRLFFHVNSKNDINVLSLFSVDVNPECLEVFDAEELNSKRKILFLDIETGCIKEVGSGFEEDWRAVSRQDMTEHLCAMLDNLTSRRAVSDINLS